MIDKNKILESTRTAVLVYSFAYIILTLIYCLPRILVEYTSFDMSHVNENFTFPLDIFAWGLMAVCSVYCGGDRATFTVKSSDGDVYILKEGDNSVEKDDTVIVGERTTIMIYVDGSKIVVRAPGGIQDFRTFKIIKKNRAQIRALFIYFICGG